MKNVEKGRVRPLVCIDPGHDSRYYNPSTVVSGYYEGAAMWDLTQRLKAELIKRGMDVRVTKEYIDHAIELVRRGQMSEGADVFISLHSNAANREAPDWVVVMHQVDNGGGVHEKSRALAELMGPAVAALMDTQCQYICQESSADREGNGLPDDYYGVLRGAQSVGTVGIIIEHGFHTNERNTWWLMDSENLQKLAVLEAELLKQWFDISDAQPPKEQWYRVRRSWDDALSQLGAYRVLEYAKASCPDGYSVFDEQGNAVWSTDTKEDFVRQVQSAIGAAVDGIAGPETLSKTPTVSALVNSSHKMVAVLQKRLYALGYTQVGEADGIAGPKFTDAVKAFQKDNGCVSDGEITAGNLTWKKLLGMN